jgi:hypothetical protein
MGVAEGVDAINVAVTVGSVPGDVPHAVRLRMTSIKASPTAVQRRVSENTAHLFR